MCSALGLILELGRERELGRVLSRVWSWWMCCRLCSSSIISGSPFWVPGGTAFPGLSVVGWDHMNGSGHQDISGSDICHFWVKYLIAGVRPRQVLFPSTMIAVSVPDGGLSTCLGVEQSPWKPHWTRNMKKQQTAAHYKPVSMGISGYHGISQPLLMNRAD